MSQGLPGGDGAREIKVEQAKVELAGCNACEASTVNPTPIFHVEARVAEDYTQSLYLCPFCMNRLQIALQTALFHVDGNPTPDEARNAS